jgi:DtxR family Mn-dependent transcriptional regulator
VENVVRDDVVAELPALTPAMEDYVQAIHAIGLGGDEVVTAAVAARLGVAAPSVTQMVQRLAAAGYLEHVRHGSITLTPEGHAAAEDIAARRELIAAYLVEALGYASETATDEADRLEHVLSDRLRERLAERLSGAA